MLHPRIRNIWEDLERLGDDYLLISGTAAVLHLGHRISRDIDLITSLALPHPRRIRELIGHPELGKHKVVRWKKHTHYIKFFQTDTTPKIDIHGREPRPRLEPSIRLNNGLQMASLTDILYHKLTAMARRSETRDGIDVAALMEAGADADKAVWAARQQDWSRHLDVEALERIITKLQEPQVHGWPESEHFNELAERLRTESGVNYTVDATRIEGEGTGRRKVARSGTTR